MKRTTPLALLASLVLGAPALGAGFFIEIDTDGLDDGPITYSPNFSFGGDTTTATTSSASTAIGLAGADSLFGGDGVNEPDTYVYSYEPAIDADNFGPAPGSLLNDDGDVVTGLPGGSGSYAVYATWPFTTNVSGGDTTFVLNDGSSDVLNVAIDQNGGGDGTGNEWIKLGEFNLDPSATYTLTQTAGSNTFVSMRAAAVLFQPVPEPAAALLALTGVGFLATRRR